MGLFNNLFGGGSALDDSVRLLKGPSTEMADEMERTYRGIIDNIREDVGPVSPSGKGILKARLFGVSFMLLPYRKKWRDDAGFMEMMNASSGLAMEPFASASYKPKISRSTAASFASDYMAKVFQATLNEMKDGPSTPMTNTSGFDNLISLYEDALKETIGNAYSSNVRAKLYPMIASAVNANLAYMTKWMDEL